MTLVRLQKYMADHGICSRRKAEEMILAGEVKVNGKIAELGMKVDSEKDKVEMSGVTPPLSYPTRGGKFVYILLNKPVDYICSNSDEQGASVLELLKKQNYWKPNGRDITERVYPVGRLDKDSEGLVLLTNDGELTNKLTHPSFEHEKEYEVTIDKQLEKDAIKVLEYGMDIGDGEYVQGVEVKKVFNKGRRTIVTIVLKEGKNRQIKKMFGRLGYHVLSLKRTRIGKAKLGVLPIGRWRFIKKEDII